jgi:hypothetical protein
MRSLLIATSFFSLFLMSVSKAQDPLPQPSVERGTNDDLGERAEPAREAESEIDYEALNGTVVEGPLIIKRIADPNQYQWIKSRVVVKVPTRPSLRHQAVWSFRGEDVFRVKSRTVKYPVWEAQWVASPTVYYFQYPTVNIPTTTLFPTPVLSPWFSNTMVIQRRPLLFPHRGATTTVIIPGVISY